MIKLSDVVGLLIKQPFEKGCVVADGRSNANVCYISLKRYRMEKDDVANGIQVVSALLSLQSLVDETRLRAQSMAYHLSPVRDVRTIRFWTGQRLVGKP
jgi:hypothetical protein